MPMTEDEKRNLSNDEIERINVLLMREYLKDLERREHAGRDQANGQGAPDGQR